MSAERTPEQNAFIMQLEKAMGELNTAVDMGRELDNDDQLLCDFYDLEDAQNALQEVCNTAEGIE